eukprot:GHVT01048344.1.p1 GENE.GHVT01048344.1~~GHVT01048344.1.p1  ORF type:complete len:118 (+),score=9.29 GHVT01048344.1:1233-1586(+)
MSIQVSEIFCGKSVPFRFLICFLFFFFILLFSLYFSFYFFSSFPSSFSSYSIFSFSILDMFLLFFPVPSFFSRRIGKVTCPLPSPACLFKWRSCLLVVWRTLRSVPSLLCGARDPTA